MLLICLCCLVCGVGLDCLVVYVLSVMHGVFCLWMFCWAWLIAWFALEWDFVAFMLVVWFIVAFRSFFCGIDCCFVWV